MTARLFFNFFFLGGGGMEGGLPLPETKMDFILKVIGSVNEICILILAAKWGFLF